MSQKIRERVSRAVMSAREGGECREGGGGGLSWEVRRVMRGMRISVGGEEEEEEEEKRRSAVNWKKEQK